MTGMRWGTALWLACFTLAYLVGAEQQWNDNAPGTRLVRSALELRDALADPDISEVLVNTSIRINGTSWGSQAVNVTRNLTIRATSALLAENRYAVIDFGTAVMLFTLGPGKVLTWIGIDAYTSHATLGPIFRPLRQSPGSIMVFSRCLIHRLVGLPVDAGIANAMSLPRPSGYAGSQQVGVVLNLSIVTTDPKPPRFLARTSAVYDYAAFVPVDSTLASQGLFFGGYVVVANGPCYYVNEYTINETCLATKAGSECLAIAIADIEADKQRQAHQQQDAADASGGGDSNTTTIVVAVVVPVGSVLLAAVVGSIWWLRRSRRREEEEEQQRAKAAANAASRSDVEAGGSQEKTGSGGARRGVLAGGVQNSDGGVFLGVDGEKDLPQWSEAAHHEPDDLGDMDQPGPATGLAGNGGRAADSVATGTMAEATGTSSIALQLRLAEQSVGQSVGQSASRVEVTLQGSQRGGQDQPPGNMNGKRADATGHVGDDRSMHDRSQRASRATTARMKPALTRALEGGAAAATLMSSGPEEDKQLTEYALSGSAGGVVDIKVPEHAPSSDEVVAELGALVKELRSNINHVAIVLEGVLGHGSFGTVYKGTWQGLPVAVKTVVFSANKDSRKHALKEAALCQSISHPNVIATYASELQPIGVIPTSAPSDAPLQSDATPPASGARSHLNIMDWRLYIIQEFADGGPLGNLYGNRALWLSPGIVNLAAVVPLALGIARALAHLHSKRIVHGDLNPNNVLLKRDPAEPSGYTVKVGDFGLSVMLPTDRTHLSNIRMGTMFYICPAVACKGQVGPAADMFSLGVILWELYHGRRAGVRTQEGPRYCSNFPAFPPTCPEIYKAATLQCLQRQPQNRPPATTVVGALEHVLANLGPAPAPEATG